MKLSLEETINVVQEVLKKQKIDDSVIKETTASIQKAAIEVREELRSERAPKVRKEYGVVALPTSDEKILKGFIFQLDENVEPHQVIEKISGAIREFNGTRKGQRRPAIAISQGIEEMPNKHFKGQGINRKNKDACYIIVSDNKLT